MIFLTVRISSLYITTDKPLGDMELKLKSFCFTSMFGVNFHVMKGSGEGHYIITFAMGRDYLEIVKEVENFLTENGLTVKKFFEVSPSP